jgi:CRP-like cAMP-binding protein
VASAHHHDILIRKLRMHSSLSGVDEGLLRDLAIRTRTLAPNEDFAREGDRPGFSTIVLSGWVARYHTLPAGRRQYLSLHLRGDWPDTQSLYLARMDHSACALGPAIIGTIHHDQLRAVFERSPAIATALWRETLIDAAIFRQAITNNSGRDAVQRVAHLLCELFYRGQKAELVEGGSMEVPLRQDQLGEVLGMALVTVNRALRTVRQTGSMDLRLGRLAVSDWDGLARFADFDPAYLHF